VIFTVAAGGARMMIQRETEPLVLELSGAQQWGPVSMQLPRPSGV